MVRLPSIGLILPGLGSLRPTVPTLGGALALLLAASFFVLLPDWRLEQLVEASGLPRLLPLARPPLGNTARLLLALVAGVVAGAVAWSALVLLFGPGGALYRQRESIVAEDRATPARPSVRRADAHPDAPPRPPLTAAELGAPLPSWERWSTPPAERGLPADLDQPLAAFDPAAIPAVPRAPVRPVASTVPPPAAVPAPVTEPVPAPLPRRDDPPLSIAALLDRLERGTRRPAAPL